MAVKDWSTTAASNTTLGGLSTQGTAPANTIDDLFREMMAQLATFFIDANFRLDSTDAGATVGPTLKLYRNSASPAASDIIGRVLFQGEDSAGNTEDYAEIDVQITDPTSTTEDATIRFRNVIAGTMSTSASISATGFNNTAIGVTNAAAGRFTTLVYTTSLTLLGGTAPTPTAEGAIEWETDTDRIIVGNGSGQAIFGQVTPWVAYTPTFTGFGTVASVDIWSRRVGDSLQIRGRFTAGTPTAVEARMTLGFNGTNSNVTSDATKVPSLQLAGTAVTTIDSATSWYTTCESNLGYITFSVQNAANHGTAKALGSTVLSAGATMILTAEVPISGW